MKKFFLLAFVIIISLVSTSRAQSPARDTSEVIQLNKQGFSSRLTSPQQTINYGERAMALAKALHYIKGIAESYRVIGIGQYYMNESVKAMKSYLSALDYFTEANDLRGEGRVYNNIANLYRDNDYDLALDYLKRSLAIAEKLNDKQLMAPLYLNMGVVYYRLNSYNQALNYYDKSTRLYKQLKDSTNLVICLQNKGVIYFWIKNYPQAEIMLTEASKEAKALDLNETIASIDLTLASLYIAENKFADAENALNEGTTFAGIVKDGKLASDFKYTSYKLELKRKNYKQALAYLQDIYHTDSVTNKQYSSTQVNLILEQAKQQARIKENEILLQRQAYDRIKFWGVTVVAALLLFVVGLLISNVKRKAKTNVQLTNLNAEVSRQKDNLDRINHHLEEIIDERTKDLQIKNKKLSEYSSYLSHQIRGPIATLKGLLNLEREGLVDQRECIRMMNKSVSEIDDKIIEMSDMLHDPARVGF